MPEFLALFPLSLTVFPGEQLKLHIFEPRYRQLLKECAEEGSTFGVSPVVDRKVSSIATEVRLVSIDQQYGTGEMDITTEGVRRAQVETFYEKAPGHLYPGGEVIWLPNKARTDLLLQEEVYDYFEQLNQALGIHRTLVDSAMEVTAYAIGHHVGFNLHQEVQLLKLDEEIARLRFIRDHLEDVIPIVQETERLKARAKLNGHYKNVIPPSY